jgi:hypothetical protein
MIWEKPFPFEIGIRPSFFQPENDPATMRQHVKRDAFRDANISPHEESAQWLLKRRRCPIFYVLHAR